MLKHIVIIIRKNLSFNMKKIIFLFSLFGAFANSNAQDCLDKIAKQAVELDSLKRNVKLNYLKMDSLQASIELLKLKQKEDVLRNRDSDKKFLDSINELKSDLSKFQKFKIEKIRYETIIKLMSDSILLFKKELVTRNEEIISATEKVKKVTIVEKENGRREVRDQIAKFYLNKSFDDLISSTNLFMIERDKRLVGDNLNVKQILLDLELFFNVRKLLSIKFEINGLTNSISKINAIKRESRLVEKLKDDLDNYKTLNDGLLNTLQRIILIDKMEYVKGMDESIVKLKLEKVISVLTNYIFVYDFNFVDYPYLNDIILDVMKRKQSDPDADILDLLGKI
jgi:hypothetical protein